MKNEKIKLICLSSIFTAIVFVFTAYLHIPSHTGYIHVGDGFIYLAACLLPLPYAVFIGASGALLADCLTGFAIWAPCSVIIKTIVILFFSSKGEKIISLHNILALLPAWSICIGGYYLYEVAISNNFISPLSGIPGYIIQSVLSSILFIAIGHTMDKLYVKQIINGGKSIL